MADAHMEEHTSLIKTPKQLIVVVVLAFLIPVLGIVMLVRLITGGMHVDPKSPAMSEEAVASRLKPVGEVAIMEGGATAAPAATPAASNAVPPSAAGAVAAAPAASKAAAAGAGEKIYASVCTVCHGAGLAGAPKVGDKAAWKPRIAQGRDTLYAHAINGIRAMPAKGGAASTPDADIKAAVDYMVAHSQ